MPLPGFPSSARGAPAAQARGADSLDHEVATTAKLEGLERQRRKVLGCMGTMCLHSLSRLARKAERCSDVWQRMASEAVAWSSSDGRPVTGETPI